MEKLRLYPVKGGKTNPGVIRRVPFSRPDFRGVMGEGSRPMGNWGRTKILKVLIEKNLLQSKKNRANCR